MRVINNAENTFWSLMKLLRIKSKQSVLEMKNEENTNTQTNICIYKVYFIPFIAFLSDCAQEKKEAATAKKKERNSAIPTPRLYPNRTHHTLYLLHFARVLHMCLLFKKRKKKGKKFKLYEHMP